MMTVMAKTKGGTRAAANHAQTGPGMSNKSRVQMHPMMTANHIGSMVAQIIHAGLSKGFGFGRDWPVTRYCVGESSI